MQGAIISTIIQNVYHDFSYFLRVLASSAIFRLCSSRIHSYAGGKSAAAYDHTRALSWSRKSVQPQVVASGDAYNPTAIVHNCCT